MNFITVAYKSHSIKSLFAFNIDFLFPLILYHIDRFFFHSSISLNDIRFLTGYFNILIIKFRYS
jgi:hypothetical protein